MSNHNTFFTYYGFYIHKLRINRVRIKNKKIGNYKVEELYKAFFSEILS